MSTATLLEPTGLSHENIAHYGESVALYHLKNSNVPIGDMRTLAKRLGGRVSRTDSFIVEEPLVVRNKSSFVITLPIMTTARRDTLLIAHQLGRYFLYYRMPGLNDLKRFTHSSGKDSEIEANIFASGLLMPSEQFIHTFREHEGDLLQVAAQLNVSPAAAATRAKVLGLPEETGTT